MLDDFLEVLLLPHTYLIFMKFKLAKRTIINLCQTNPSFKLSWWELNLWLQSRNQTDFFFLYTENLQLYSWNKDEDEHQNSRLFQVINAARSIPVTFSSIMLDTVNWSPRITNSVLRANLWCSWPGLWYMSSYMLWQCIKSQGFLPHTIVSHYKYFPVWASSDIVNLKIHSALYFISNFVAYWSCVSDYQILILD